ncbi:MAG: HD domain-containing phosphohydrolase [Chloroflexota bacterium]
MFKSFPAPSQQELLEQVILTAYVAEFTEWDNHAHVERIRRYTHILARETGLEHDEASLLSSASMLHDVGKIALPAPLLQKTAKLTPDEYRIAEQHTVEGHRLLAGSGSPLLQAAEIICRTHHERWDGSGFPEGLRGEAIPLSGRIVALADVFDALTTKRAYKTAIKLEAAFELIKSSSGTLFDPLLVSIFVERFEDFSSVLRMTDETAGDTPKK